MGCPVHIWVPMMAAAAPFARTARDAVRGWMPSAKAPASPLAPREIKRWAPVGSPQPDADPATR